MTTPEQSSGRKEKLLFTPGPLTTSEPVKQAMLRDLGSRDTAFIATIGKIRNGLLGLAGPLFALHVKHLLWGEVLQPPARLDSQFPGEHPRPQIRVALPVVVQGMAL